MSVGPSTRKVDDLAKAWASRRVCLASRAAMTAVSMTERPAYHLAERILDDHSDSDVWIERAT